MDEPKKGGIPPVAYGQTRKPSLAHGGTEITEERGDYKGNGRQKERRNKERQHQGDEGGKMCI